MAGLEPARAVLGVAEFTVLSEQKDYPRYRSTGSSPISAIHSEAA
jgi:hypothetical protein